MEASSNLGWTTGGSPPAYDRLLDDLPSFEVPTQQIITPSDTSESPARFLRRVDRKYVVTVVNLQRVLQSLLETSTPLEVLTVDGHREQTYETSYFDSPNLRLYEEARARRPDRCKIRVRFYENTGGQVLEVKQRSRDGMTSKFRRPWSGELDGEAHEFLVGHIGTRALAHLGNDIDGFVDDLAATATTRYTRIALRLDDTARVTIDRDLRFGALDAATHSLPGSLIVETKSDGPPTEFDRQLWNHGTRPTTISKYALAVAVLDPTRPTNRWSRHARNLTHI